MQNLGWRKPTPGLVAAEMHAQVGEGLSVPKSKAIIAVKKVAAHIGMKPAQLMLLDILFAFSKPQDWEQGQRPVVWPSNQYLMDQTGFSLPALKRHLRRLGELGLISFHDSANGKRYGHRDAEGNIIEAYGFDLSPMAARAEAFETLHAEILAERKAQQQLKSEITRIRRTIRAKLVEALTRQLAGPWLELEAEFQAIIAPPPQKPKGERALKDLIQGLRHLKHAIEALYAKCLKLTPPEPEQTTENHQNLTPNQLSSDPHIQATNQSSLNSNRTKPEKKQTRQEPQQGFDFQTFCLACPNFIQITQDLCGQVRCWNDLTKATQRMGLMLGISQPAWRSIIAQIGHYPSAVALGLTYEKHVAGVVDNPPAYLSGMAKKARTGELHLGKSLFARLVASGQGRAA